jgi:Arc/MetJ family transcription regulator
MIIDDEILKQAQAATGIKEKTALVHEGLKALIRAGAARRLIALGGTMPHLKPFKRKRPVW